MDLARSTKLTALAALPAGADEPIGDAPGWRAWQFGNGDVLVSEEKGPDLIVTPKFASELELVTLGDAVQAAKDNARTKGSLAWEVSVVILAGGVLLGPGVSVGPLSQALGPVRYGCLQDPGGVERLGWHRVPFIDERGDADATTEDDTSPFGAAYLFVHLVGELVTARALRAWRNKYDRPRGV